MGIVYTYALVICRTGNITEINRISFRHFNVSNTVTIATHMDMQSKYALLIRESWVEVWWRLLL